MFSFSLPRTFSDEIRFVANNLTLKVFFIAKGPISLKKKTFGNENISSLNVFLGKITIQG